MESISTMMKVSEYLGFELKGSTIRTTTRGSIKWGKKRQIIVPAFQREISWKDSQVKALLSDIKHEKKFLGTILLSKSKEDKFDLIDGQQRTTVIYLLLNYLAIKNSEDLTEKLCKFKNDTFSDLDYCIQSDFSLDIVKSKIYKSDYLNQFEDFQKIWLCIKNEVDLMTNKSDRQSFMSKIMGCDLNVIVCDVSNSDENKKTCVNYYLDLNDKSVPLDNTDILKAQLFLEDYDNMTKRWSNLLRNLGEISHRVYYPINSFFYHYFLSVSNEKLEWKLKKYLGENLKIPNDIEFSSGDKVRKGEHVVRAVPNANIVKEMFEELECCSKFYLDILKNDDISLESSVFKGLSAETKANIKACVRSILMNDDVVPKMLVMKYFVSVLNQMGKKTVDDRQKKSIYPIFVSSTYFVVVPEKGRKGSSKFATIINGKNWVDEIYKYAGEVIDKKYCKVDYFTKITKMKTADKTSGQFFPLYLMIARQYFDVNSKQCHLTNTKELGKALESTLRFNAEHFLINQSYTYEFEYKGEKLEIQAISKIKSRISMPFNYLYMDSKVNATYGNRTAYEKIKYIESFDPAEIKRLFKTELSYKYYIAAKEVFYDSTSYPNVDLCKNANEAKRLVRRYYSNCFFQEVEKYIEKLKELKIPYDYDKSEFTL